MDVWFHSSWVFSGSLTFELAVAVEVSPLVAAALPSEVATRATAKSNMEELTRMTLVVGRTTSDFLYIGKWQMRCHEQQWKTSG
ncbi:hypothetical protein L917_02588 [Phytophthora nicotianae]|uniref:Uncharacterized protein n=2 Tax=Phytophthora nicotianae TaxID=4792 RepID=W2JMM8_PHYNI|nr:hypothetical protein L916_02648 [Phytophthora nicotianae]ETM00712.1 hypothetical protein L917_02588 [Phytophthora nicotianae]